MYTVRLIVKKILNVSSIIIKADASDFVFKDLLQVGMRRAESWKTLLGRASIPFLTVVSIGHGTILGMGSLFRNVCRSKAAGLQPMVTPLSPILSGSKKSL